MTTSSKTRVPPVFIVKGMIKFTNFLEKIRIKILPAPAVLMVMSSAPLLSRCLHVAADLGIADCLKDRPKTAAELARELNVQEDAIYRIMRALSTCEVFKELSYKQFSLGRLGRYLLSDAENSMLPWVRFLGARWHLELWLEFPLTVKNGKSIVENAHGATMFEWLAKNPEAQSLFNKAMY